MSEDGKPPQLRLQISEELKEALENDASENERSINDIVRSILHGYFALPYESTERRSNGNFGTNSLSLSVPASARLHREIGQLADRRRAARRKLTKNPLAIYSKNEVVGRVLCEHYELAYVPRPSGRPRRAVA